MALSNKKSKSVKSSVMLTLGITLLVFILGYFIFLKILNKKNILTQDLQKQELIQSINAVLQTKNDAYGKMVFDYSVFSWMIDFINHPNKKEGEMTISHPQNVGISFIQIYNLNKKLVYNDLAPILKDTVLIASEVFDSLYHDRKINFYINTKYGLVQVFGSTVHPSDDIYRQTAPNGFVIFGKLWDKDYVNILKKITNCNISLYLSNLLPENHSNEVGEIFFQNYKSQKVAHINISKINPFLENIKVLNNYFNIFFVCFCLVLFFIIYYTYISLVINPLKKIETSLSNENTSSIEKIINRNDEFGKIAKLIGWFFMQRDELKGKIEELKIAHKSLHNLNDELSQQKKEIVTQNTKLQLLNEEMQGQNEEIISIAEGLHSANKEITDSINYASFIQNAVLSPSFELSRIFPDHFVFYAPKNIVSGDFYWFKEMQNGERILAVADCTGHGLSGALLSMLGISFLNQITLQLENEGYTAATILDSLKCFFIDALHQNNEIENIQDGINIALCIFDKYFRSFQYATAFHTICLVRNNYEKGVPELTEYRGDHIPVGIHITDEKFTNHIVEIQQNDVIYMYSDGIVDQFGGPDNKKYKPSRMRDFLLAISQMPFFKQKEKIVSEFKTWKGSFDQTDDVIVVGIKIP